MAARLDALTVLAAEPQRLATFWGDLLGWERAGVMLMPDADAPMRLVFEQADLGHDQLNQIHFHLTSYTSSQQTNVERALSLGATHRDVGQRPEEGHVVLADPEGNEFCIIEGTNNWLAGTGFLGELAADGTREVGIFWSAALDWPLVHDEGGETAIQPPGGRMKIAWGGPPLNERNGRNRMHFVLVADGDLDPEVGRLVSLGATVVVHTDANVVAMADPDGNEFWVWSAGRGSGD